jgi:S-adenosylmethionine:tRNA ribosyltransferase-isomerase
MPSAARPFTADLVVELVRRGVTIVPILLHTGVSSLEGNEMPYPERYRVSESTAAQLNAVHANGGRVIAVGTTVVRALESVTDSLRIIHPGSGWTELVVTPERGVRAVDGLVTGWHEPEATHLLMLEAIAGQRTLELAYTEARRAGYLWHEFGDTHLLLPNLPVPGGAR